MSTVYLAGLQLNIAINHRAELAQLATDYEAECDRWLRKGFRPHYCEHGTDMWVDHDCACWQCEADYVLSFRYAENRFRISREYAAQQIAVRAMSQQLKVHGLR